MTRRIEKAPDYYRHRECSQQKSCPMTKERVDALRGKRNYRNPPSSELFREKSPKAGRGISAFWRDSQDAA